VKREEGKKRKEFQRNLIITHLKVIKSEICPLIEK